MDHKSTGQFTTVRVSEYHVLACDSNCGSSLHKLHQVNYIWFVASRCWCWFALFHLGLTALDLSVMYLFYHQTIWFLSLQHLCRGTWSHGKIIVELCRFQFLVDGNVTPGKPFIPLRTRINWSWFLWVVTCGFAGSITRESATTINQHQPSNMDMRMLLSEPGGSNKCFTGPCRSTWVFLTMQNIKVTRNMLHFFSPDKHGFYRANAGTCVGWSVWYIMLVLVSITYI